ncbi:hypothetical protein MBCUT_05020 [Methanobrevibacter cuticularis]|uniref:Uncharacterized protein n=1 Tax=Methanobrevibacter cuticularis TaxID=47311 RepID=A0A166EPJ6_9EURY|nr:hypothetical protein [Methanobrevibacter cuticularis]KZX16872.1 hypothetical protein MBCUT_05020 [Methanobrevibacter cuticularis]
MKIFDNNLNKKTVNIFNILLLCFVCLATIATMGGVSAHGADVTDNVMVVTNESNAIDTKKLVDKLDLPIKVYKFNTVADADHILEHALTNPNKRMLVVAFQESTKEYIKSHNNLTNRVMVVDVKNNEDIEKALLDFNSTLSDTSNSAEGNLNIDYTTLILIVAIIGLVSGIGVFLLRSKK